MKKLFCAPISALVFAATLGWSGAALATVPAGAVFYASASNSKSKHVSTKHKSEPKVKSVQFYRGSEESAGERSARLRRECKGAVNGGACAGYTR